MKAAVIQMNTGDDKHINLVCAESLIRDAAFEGTELVALPEMFNWRGPLRDFVNNAESIPGPTTERLSRISASYKIHILAGSIAEKAPHQNRVFNTSVLIKKDGDIAACYRKIHLFNFRLKNGSLINENRIFLPGDKAVVAQLPGFKAGLSICFDLRFPELYRTLSACGCSLFFVPSAFTFETGKLHWEILLRARAIENQAYILAPNQCGTNMDGVKDYGHSMIIGPRGEVLGTAIRQTDMVIAELNFSYVREVRKLLPISSCNRQTTLKFK